MSRENAYSPGQRLRATVVAIQMNTSVRTVLNKWEPQESHEWDELADELRLLVLNSVREKRESSRKPS